MKITKRKKPYTAIGIRRIKCSKKGCNNSSLYQWQCCALGNNFFTLCAEHDIGLNEITCNYILGPQVKTLIKNYKKKVLAR